MLTFRLPLTFEECYQGRLLDLGDSLSNEYRDIYRDPDTFDVTMPGVSSAFTAQAKEYVDQLEDENHVVHYERAFKQAFSVMQWTDREAPKDSRPGRRIRNFYICSAQALSECTGCGMRHQCRDATIGSSPFKKTPWNA